MHGWMPWSLVHLNVDLLSMYRTIPILSFLLPINRNLIWPWNIEWCIWRWWTRTVEPLIIKPRWAFRILNRNYPSLRRSPLLFEPVKSGEVDVRPPRRLWLRIQRCVECRRCLIETFMRILDESHSEDVEMQAQKIRDEAVRLEGDIHERYRKMNNTSVHEGRREIGTIWADATLLPKEAFRVHFRYLTNTREQIKYTEINKDPSVAAQLSIGLCVGVSACDQSVPAERDRLVNISWVHHVTSE
jgi:hypothetical protein